MLSDPFAKQSFHFSVDFPKLNPTSADKSNEVKRVHLLSALLCLCSHPIPAQRATIQSLADLLNLDDEQAASVTRSARLPASLVIVGFRDGD